VFQNLKLLRSGNWIWVYSSAKAQSGLHPEKRM